MSKTQVRTVQATRPHDHVYDPVYTVSNHATHYAEANAARMSTIQRMPNHANMFSDMPRYQRHMYRMHPAKQAGIPVLPMEGKMRAPPANDVMGAHRLKFFQRAKVPFLQSVPAEVLLAPNARPAPVAAPEPSIDDPAFQPKTRTTAVQTMYRESSTQTDPYTRDYMTAEGQPDPEILSIAHLTYGAGLPASLEEINLIHRMREKAKFEASLPPLTDQANFELRKKLLEEREMQEWNLREEEMRKDQEEKLQILIQTLKAREAKSDALNEARIDAIRQQKLHERDVSFSTIHQERIKVHRGLAKTRSKVEQKSRKRDVVSDHANYASRVYAPMTREGRLPVSNQVVDYGIPLINNYQGLSALEQNLPDALNDTRVIAPKKLKMHKTRKLQKIAADLEKCDRLLVDDNTKPSDPDFENVYRKFEPILRAQTPVVPVPVNEDANKAILLLQRLLRGRAVQNTMYKGKEHALHLIRELRLAENPVQEPEEDPSVAIDAAFDSMQGDIVSNALDFISKEITRRSEEEKIKVLVEVAKQTRRVREAEESGRRQAHDLKRKKREQQYRVLTEESSRSADQYLDELIDDSIEELAHRNAMHTADVKDDFLEVLVANLENQNNSSDEIAADMVNGWLFPEVERRHQAQQEQIANRAYLQTAHRTVLDIVSTVLNIQDAHSDS